MSADRIRMPAGALIVAKTTIRRVGSTRAHTPPESLYFCCHVVTLSHFEYNHLKIYLLCAWQQCDNKNSLAHCCHAVKHLYINVFPPPWQRDNKKTEFFLGGGEEEKACCSPTVPSGDTPCVTAGDARRVNPWRSGEGSLRHRRCRTAPTTAQLQEATVYV